VAADLRKPPRNAVGRQDEVHAAAVDRAVRHARVLRGILLLGERDAANGLDLAQAQGAVGPGAGEHDRDGLGLLVLGQRPEQVIDWQV